MVAQSTNECLYQTEITIMKEKLIGEKYVPVLFHGLCILSNLVLVTLEEILYIKESDDQKSKSP